MRVVGFKQARQHIPRDCFASAFDGQPALIGNYANPPTLRCVAQRVRQQIIKHPLKQLSVGADRTAAFCRKRHPLRFRCRMPARRAFLYERTEINRFPVQRQCPGFQPRKVKHPA